MALVFFYPQFKKITGAERLILKLADYASRRLPPGEVILLTHRFAETCRPALAPGVRLVETGWPMQLTGNHYLDAAVEYALGPALALRIPRGALRGVVFFGPPSVPAMWFARRILFPLTGTKTSLLYFCFEPPRFIYSDTAEVAARLGKFGPVMRVLAAAYRILDRRMVRSANQILSNSPYGARRIQRAYGRRATVIEHGVDFIRATDSEVESLRARYGLEGRQVAITVNHLHPRKRIDLFLRAVEVASRSIPGVTALIVGGGPEEASLKVLANDLGMKEGRDVIFTAAVPEAELPAHYALGDVYVHTGKEESFGLSVIEALAAGLPVVSVNEGGPCDTVQDGISGYLVEPSPDALGAAIEALLAEPERAREMGKAGARYVDTHFKWQRGADTLLRLRSSIGPQVAPPHSRN